MIEAGCIYEIKAVWTEREEGNGWAVYGFRAVES